MPDKDPFAEGREAHDAGKSETANPYPDDSDDFLVVERRVGSRRRRRDLNGGLAMPDEDQIESEIQAKGLTAPRLTPAAIDAVIATEHYHVFPGSTLTVCALTLRNGFVVTGESAAASAENFDADMGRVLARINAREKIWALEGYLLRQRLSRSGNDARALDVIETVLKKVHANAETQSGYYWTVNVDRRSTKPVLTQWDADMGLWSFMGVSATAGPHELILASGRVDLW